MVEYIVKSIKIFSDGILSLFKSKYFSFLYKLTTLPQSRMHSIMRKEELVKTNSPFYPNFLSSLTHRNLKRCLGLDT